MTPIHFSELPRELDDTKPTSVAGSHKTVIRLLNISLLGAAGLLTVMAGLLYAGRASLDGNRSTPAPQITVLPYFETTITTPTLAPTATQEIRVLVIDRSDNTPDSAVLNRLMLQPPNLTAPDGILYRQQTAFTIAPARPRAAIVEYKIQVGDTVEKIAKRFNLSQDTLIWNNDITYLNRLVVGTVLRIPPIDGVVYQPTTDETIQTIATKFKVSPYAIIDSEYNRLQSALPETLIPANELEIMIPGGVTDKKAIYWKPQIDTRAGTGRGLGQVNFGGGAGSCGFVSNGGGDGSLGIPLGGYTVRGTFGLAHTGLDLAASTGTTIVAAGSGTVIFAGWSEWGYGNAVVIAHTPTLWTLYGHMSRINVTCGQFVNRGTPVGAVGSTGNSTGPHLHFETRLGGDPVNPIQFLGGI